MVSHLSRLLEKVQNPRPVFLKLLEMYHRDICGRGVSVVDEEWDNLLVLDGCRYDTFRDEHDLSGRLDAVYSQGSQTVQFLQENFGDGEYPEIVYVSANPNINKLSANFHKRVRLWETNWDDQIDVVPAEAVTDEARSVFAEYPNKRLIIHYMQPHFPFIGEFGQSLYADGHIEHHSNGRDFWAQMDRSTVSKADVVRAYRENLQVALAAVDHLLDDLPGQTVVTSDHGNEFGTWGIYGHPANTFTKNLRKVPWFRVADGEKRRITSGTATDGPKAESDEIEQRLEALGYV